MLHRFDYSRLLKVSPFVLALAVCAMPAVASAQDNGGTAPPVPSYARPAAPSDEETIRGRIVAINGKYGLDVRDDRSFIDNVQMHDGTIINPTGLMLRPGMSVTIMGYNRGRVFEANQIDTPYQSFGYVYGPYPYPGFVFAPRFGFHWR